MVRRLSLLMGLFAALFFVSLPVRAQESDKVEVFGGYSYLRFNPNGPNNSTNLNGWELSGQYNFAPWIGGVGDFSGDYGGIRGLSDSSSVHTFLFGPQVSFPARVSPFAHVLIGGAHISGGGASDTAFASAVGAGIDAKVAHGVSWRVFQADWLHTHFFGDGQNNVRISTGLVFRF
jgi:hypothetical protein